MEMEMNTLVNTPGRFTDCFLPYNFHSAYNGVGVLINSVYPKAKRIITISWTFYS